MDNTSKKLYINTNTTDDFNNLSPEKKSFMNKLYLDPIESLNRKLAETKSRGFRIKTDVSKTNTEFSSGMTMTSPLNTGMTMPQMTTNKRTFNMNRTQGNVIMQNWETSKNIPSDIGEFIHFPVLVDRKKLRLGMEQNKGLSYTTTKDFKFSKNKIRKDGEKLVKSLYAKQNLDNMALTMPPNYPGSQIISTEESKPKDIIDRNLMTFQKMPKDLMIVTNEEEEEESSLSSETKIKQFSQKPNQMALTVMTPSAPKINIEKSKASKLIDFSTFNKHLFLKDNDFLYAKRVGGPVDYVLCSYQDINKKSKMSSNLIQLKKKKLEPIKKKPHIMEYITISKNTVLHYQKGVPVVYSIQEWIDNYNKYKLLMKIPLFKNFKNAKLLDSWRRFYRKT